MEEKPPTRTMKDRFPRSFYPVEGLLFQAPLATSYPAPRSAPHEKEDEIPPSWERVVLNVKP